MSGNQMKIFHPSEDVHFRCQNFYQVSGRCPTRANTRHVIYQDTCHYYHDPFCGGGLMCGGMVGVVVGVRGGLLRPRS